MAAKARASVLADHTCRHRAEQLLRIISTLDRVPRKTPSECEEATP
jgi:spore maturation protein CgeB